MSLNKNHPSKTIHKKPASHSDKDDKEVAHKKSTALHTQDARKDNLEESKTEHTPKKHHTASHKKIEEEVAQKPSKSENLNSLQSDQTLITEITQIKHVPKVSREESRKEGDFFKILMPAVVISSSIIIMLVLFLIGFGWSDYNNFKQAKASEIEELQIQNNSLLAQQAALDRQLKAGNKPQAPEAPTTLTNVPKPDFKNEISKGNQNSNIVFIEYSDLQCSFCAKIQPDVEKLSAEFTEVGFIFRHYPLTQIHPNAIPYAQGVECAKDQKGNPAAYDLIEQILVQKPEITKLGNLAKQIGIDQAKFESCMSSGKFKAKVDTDSQNSSKLLGGSGLGTPTSVLYNTKNGKNKVISGALPYEQLKLELQNFSKNSN